MATASERIINGIKTRVLHGKDYVEVAERVRIVHELKKKFEMIESGALQVADRWLWRVVIKVDDLQYIGDAEIKLSAPKSTPDGTNPFECAETSALGRALAFAGLGTVESIASYDEIMRGQPFTAVVESSNGSRQLEQPKPPTLKERVDTAYTQMVEKGLITPTSDKSQNATLFLEICAKAIGANVTALGQITASRMDLVERYITTTQVVAS
jgi:hypothetical protein